MAQATCPACGEQNPYGTLACFSCRSPLPAHPESLEDLGGAKTRRVSRLGPPKTNLVKSSLQQTAPPAYVEGDGLGYVFCEPFQPLELREGVDFVLGRHVSCDMRLPHNTLSRRHARVFVQKGQILFEDTSSNGSWINGQRPEGVVTLEAGDVITIGPYDIEIRSGLVEDFEDDGSGTVVLDFTSRITGEIENDSLMSAMQGLEFNCNSGSLDVQAGRNLRGEVVFSKGQPIRARWGELNGLNAMFVMLGLRAGRYIFTHGSQSGEREITTPLTGILLEFARRQDEDPPTEPR